MLYQNILSKLIVKQSSIFKKYVKSLAKYIELNSLMEKNLPYQVESGQISLKNTK